MLLIGYLLIAQSTVDMYGDVLVRGKQCLKERMNIGRICVATCRIVVCIDGTTKTVWVVSYVSTRGLKRDIPG